MAAASTSSEIPPLGRYLASTEKKTRDKAIKSLATFLSEPSRDALPKAEMSKLWKGIFYCFWMSDKPLVQQALATEIADIVLAIPKTSTALGFLQGFWESIVREWGGIDHHRMDKYYLLVRRFVNASFRLLMREGWEASVCDEYNSILTQRGGPLCAEDPRIPTSLAYHLTDIYLEELDKSFIASPTSDALPAPVFTLASPFLHLLAKTSTNAMYQRLQSRFVEPLLDACNTSTGTDTEEEDEGRSRKRARLSHSSYDTLMDNACLDSPSGGVLDKVALKKALLRKIFDVASAESTRDPNRRKMYALVRTYADDDEADASS